MIAIIGPVVTALAPSVIGTGILTELTPRQTVPKVKPGDLLRAAVEIQQLSERGLEPRFARDPFTGDFVVFTADQPIGAILEERAARQLGAATPADIEEIRQLRQQIIEERRGFSVQPTTPTARSSTEGLVTRGSRIRARTDSRPAVNRSRDLRAGLSDQCAGRTNAFNCLRALG